MPTPRVAFLSGSGQVGPTCLFCPRNSHKLLYYEAEINTSRLVVGAFLRARQRLIDPR